MQQIAAKKTTVEYSDADWKALAELKISREPDKRPDPESRGRANRNARPTQKNGG